MPRAIILILLLSTLLRLLTVSNLLVFSPDEAYQTYLAQTLIKNFHIIWIGMSAGSFDLFLGPFWIYFIYPFLWIFSGDPVILGYIGGILGVITTFLIYLIGKKSFSEKVGLLASLLYAISPLLIYYDQKPYPNGISILSVLMLFSMLMTKFSKWWWVLFAASYGLVFHVHLSLIPVIFVAIYWVISNRKTLSKKVTTVSILVFLMVVSPLIAFDFLHDFSNVSTPLRILKNSSEFSSNHNHFGTLFESMGRVIYLNPNSNSADEILWPCDSASITTRTTPIWIISLLSMLTLLYFMIKKENWKDKNRRLLILLSFVFLIPFTVLGIINPVEYYLVGFFPIFFLMLGILVDGLKKSAKIWAYTFIGIIVLMGIYTVISAKGEYGLSTKKKLIAEVMNVLGNDPYELDEMGDCHRYGGWRYLFSVYGRKPEKSSEDKSFGWLYPDELSNRETKYSVIIKETRAPSELEPGYKYMIDEGGFSAYIFEK